VRYMVKQQYRTYEQAKTFVLSLNLKNTKEWYIYCKSGNNPIDIPNSPNSVYKNKGWTNWSDFLGTKNLYTRTKTFRTYEQARTYVRTLNIKNEVEWFIYSKSGNNLIDIPFTPQNYYKNKGWISWQNFLGTEYYTFEQAREIAQTLNLKTATDWYKYWGSNRPNKMPSNPDVYYKWDGWTYWWDFLGNWEAIKKHKKEIKREQFETHKKNKLEERKREYIHVNYKLPTGTHIINKEGKLLFGKDPVIHLYQDYYCIVCIAINIYKVVKGSMVLNVVESNYILNNYKQVIKNGEQKILEEIVKSYESYFSAKNKKGRIFICNSANINKGAKLLANLFNKYIVLVTFK